MTLRSEMPTMNAPNTRATRGLRGSRGPRGIRIDAYILSCPAREVMREQTIANLRATDWGDEPQVEIDQTTFARRQERQESTALRLLQRAVADGPDYILFLEDDLEFNRHLRFNLEHWYPLVNTPPRRPFFASLYNPNGKGRLRTVSFAAETRHAYFVVDPNTVFGSQAFLLSLVTARYIVEHWNNVIGMQDIKMSRLAARFGPIYYHTPSLVQHVGVDSAWGGPFQWSADYAGDWKAAAI